jgi:hypothetical protein
MMNSTKEEQRKRKLLKCIHFNGTINKKCERGVDYDTVMVKTVLPCFWDGADMPCLFREYPNVAQLDEEDRQFGIMMTNMFTVRKAITDKTQGKRNQQGVIDCPVCKTGKVRYSVAFNGHIHADCTTDKCVSWIE